VNKVVCVVRLTRPPRPIEDITVATVLLYYRRPRSANQRLRISMRHMADQSAIASGIDASD